MTEQRIEEGLPQATGSQGMASSENLMKVEVIKGDLDLPPPVPEELDPLRIARLL